MRAGSWHNGRMKQTKKATSKGSEPAAEILRLLMEQSELSTAEREMVSEFLTRFARKGGPSGGKGKERVKKRGAKKASASKPTKKTRRR